MTNAVQDTLMTVMGVALLAMILGWFGTIALNPGSTAHYWAAYPAVFGTLIVWAGISLAVVHAFSSKRC